MRYTVRFNMPSWKTGIIKRLRGIDINRILDVIMVVLFFLLITIVPLVLAFLTPPMMEFPPF